MEEKSLNEIKRFWGNLKNKKKNSKTKGKNKKL